MNPEEQKTLSLRLHRQFAEMMRPKKENPMPAHKILWDTVPTINKAQSASVVTGDKIRRGQPRKCSHGGGLISESECLKKFTAGEELCTRGGLCSVGMFLAKREAA